MNLEYLNSLPEEKNKFKVPLEAGEKIVFTAKNVIFGTETQRLLGFETKVTMTNRHIFADNGKGVWTIDIADDIVSCRVFDEGKGLNKSHGVALDMNKQVVCGDPRDPITLTGYVFGFKKKVEAQFMEIMNSVLGG